MSVHKPSRTFSSASDLSLTSVLLRLSLSHSISAPHPPHLVRRCPPNHLSSDVYGPFCFCVLMTTVRRSSPLPMRPDERGCLDASLTPPCPWPQRRRHASQLGPIKNEAVDLGGAQLKTCPSSCGRMLAAPPPPSPLYPASGRGQLAAAVTSSLILRWRMRPCLSPEYISTS